MLTKKNPFDEAHSKAMDEFEWNDFGYLEINFKSEKELEENLKRRGGGNNSFYG